MASWRTSIVIAITLASSNAMADIPDPPTLNRYGVTSDDLPAARLGKPVEAPAQRPRFEVKPQGPWLWMAPSKPSSTGNISIDRSAQQERERCLRLQGEALQRRDGWAGCELGDPGAEIGTGFNR